MHKTFTQSFFILLLSMGLPRAQAHPTSFQGAWSLVNESSHMGRHTMFTYSHRYWLASALHYAYFPLEEEGLEYEMAAVGVNTLLKRWNRPTSQGNFYLSLAQGREFTQGLSGRPVSLVEVDLDWEDRRYYIATGYTRHFRQSFDSDSVGISDIEVKKLRMGFAPYLGEFTELNTWFIMQAMQVNQGSVELTPLLRFYYRNALWEIGSSLKGGGFLFNFMLHM